MSAEYRHDFAWFKKEFLTPDKPWPTPFLRKDLSNNRIDYTDGDHHDDVLYSPSVLLGLTEAEYTDLLHSSGVRIPVEFTQFILGISQDELRQIAQETTLAQPAILIGSGVRHLYVKYCRSIKAFLPNQAESYFRASFNAISSDLDIRTTPEHLEQLQEVFTSQTSGVLDSRTYPNAKKLVTSTRNGRRLEFLAFPVRNQIVTHLFEATDFPEGVFAIIMPDGELNLEDPLGARIMQPFSSIPPFPKDHFGRDFRLRDARNAIRMACTTDRCPPELQNMLLEVGATLNAYEFTKGSLIPGPAAVSVNEAFLSIFKQSPKNAPTQAKVLGETGLLQLLISTGINAKNLEVLTRVYWLASEMFTHIPELSLDFDKMFKFYKGHITLITPSELIDACYSLLDFHPSLYARQELEVNSYHFSGDSRDKAISQKDDAARNRNRDFLVGKDGSYTPDSLPWPEENPIPVSIPQALLHYSTTPIV